MGHEKTAAISLKLFLGPPSLSGFFFFFKVLYNILAVCFTADDLGVLLKEWFCRAESNRSCESLLLATSPAGSSLLAKVHFLCQGVPNCNERALAFWRTAFLSASEQEGVNSSFCSLT